MTIAWFTDIHLDRCTPARVTTLCNEIRGIGANAAIVTGDISNSSRLVADLERLHDALQAPLNLVLGNHDHYGSSVGAVRDAVTDLAERCPDIRWLPPAGVVELPDGRHLVGVDGWADGRHGNPLTTPIVLNDDRLIAELAAQPDRLGRLAVRRVLADADARRLATLIDRAIAAGSQHLMVATHVPPFTECIPAASREADPSWYPVLICAATGEVLRAAATVNPEVEFDVLAGHSHLASRITPLPNLTVTVAEAHYGDPRIQLI